MKSPEYYGTYIQSVYDAMSEMVVSLRNKDRIDADEGVLRWCQLTAKLKAAGNTMYMVGNGASAMMASHMAADASKNGEFRCSAFNDPALLTAVSNDISYEQSFAMPLGRFARPKDVLVTISSSGNSPNIIAAIKAASDLDLTVVTLSGMGADNRSRQLGDLNFYIPAETYGLVEVSHQILLHCWLDQFMELEHSQVA